MCLSTPCAEPSAEADFRMTTGKLALQADGAVHAAIGEMEVLVAATASRRIREGIDFFR